MNSEIKGKKYLYLKLFYFNFCYFLSKIKSLKKYASTFLDMYSIFRFIQFMITRTLHILSSILFRM